MAADAAPPAAGRVHLERKALSELVGAEYNPRTISPEALAGLGASIGKFGLVQPVVWNRRTQRVVGGHQRAKALQAQGAVETDVVVVDLPEAEERALNLALNSSAISGEWTADALPLLEEVARELPGLAADLRMGDLESALRDLFPTPVEELADDPVPQRPAVPVTQPGDLWVLGRHRLLCGDATSPRDVARVLDGKAPFLLVTDPPYGVEYDPAWRNEAGVASTERVGTVQNDDRADWREAFALFPGDVAYVWHAGVFASVVHAGLLATGFEVRAQIIWRKPRFALSRGAYHWGHEPCWYAVRKGASAKWCGDRTQSTVWDIGPHTAEDVATVHSTQKPAECMGRPIRNHGAPGDLVYDPFVGSGTTLIAAERLDRSCCAIEIDPGYCDVVVARYEAATGAKAERKSD